VVASKPGSQKDSWPTLRRYLTLLRGLSTVDAGISTQFQPPPHADALLIKKKTAAMPEAWSAFQIAHHFAVPYDSARTVIAQYASRFGL